MKITCPDCQVTFAVEDTLLAQALGSKGGAAGTGSAKRRPREHYVRMAALAKAKRDAAK